MVGTSQLKRFIPGSVAGTFSVFGDDLGLVNPTLEIQFGKQTSRGVGTLVYAGNVVYSIYVYTTYTYAELKQR